MQRHINSGSSFLGLYEKFSRLDEGFRMSKSVPIREARMVENADSLTTQLCVGFTTLLGSSHYDILELSMVRHSSISTARGKTLNNRVIVVERIHNPCMALS